MDENTVTKSIPPRVFAKGPFNGYLTQYNSFDSFFMQLLSEEVKLIDLTDNLMNSVVKFSPLSSIEIDAYVICLGSDKQYYRAKVISKENSLVKVYYLDYGVYEEIPPDSIFKNDNFKDFFQMPPFAIHCKFSNKISDKENLKIKLEKDLVNFSLEKYDHSINICNITMSKVIANSHSGFLSKRNDEGKHEAFLTQFNSLDSFYIQMVKEKRAIELLSEQLIDATKNALPLDALEIGDYVIANGSDNKNYRAQIISLVDKDSFLKIEVFYIDYGVKEEITLNCIFGNHNLKNFFDLSPFAIHCKTWDSKLIDEKQFIVDINKKLLNIEIEKSGNNIYKFKFLNIDKISEKMKEFMPIRNGLQGNHDAYLTQFNSCNCFYMQLVDDEQYVIQLSNKLKEVVSESYPMATINIGSFAIAKGLDDEFYRAYINSIDNDNTNVYYVDYGVIENVMSKHLYHVDIYKDFFTYAPYAIHCKNDDKSIDQEKFKNNLHKDIIKICLEKSKDHMYNCQIKEIISNTKEDTKCHGLKTNIIIPNGLRESLKINKKCIDNNSHTSSTEIDNNAIQLKQRHFKNESHEVYTIRIDSLNSFYVHLKSEEKELYNYQKIINKSLNLNPLDTITKDTYCVAEFSDFTLHRCKILKVFTSNVTVQSIDYSVIENVENDQLFAAVEENGFFTYPPFAIHCQYSESDPLKIYSEFNCKVFRNKTLKKYVNAIINQINEDRPTLTIQENNEMITLDDITTIVLDDRIITSNCVKAHVATSYSVQLFYVQIKNEQHDLTKMMLSYNENSMIPLKYFVEGKMCLAVGEDYQIYRSQIVKIINESETQVIYIDFGLIKTILNDNIYKFINNKDLTIPPFAIACSLCGAECMDPNSFDNKKFNEYIINKDIECIFNPSLDNLKYICTIMENGAQINYKQFLKDSSGNPIRLEKSALNNGIYNGFICNCDTLESFYVQLVENEVILNKLHEKINSVGNKVLLRNIVIGEYCIVKASDGLFYRGIVKDLVTFNMVTVFCVDYGFKENIYHNHVFKPNRQSGFTNQAPFSIECKLTHYNNINSSEINLKTFIEQTLDKELILNLTMNGDSTCNCSVKVK